MKNLILLLSVIFSLNSQASCEKHMNSIDPYGYGVKAFYWGEKIDVIDVAVASFHLETDKDVSEFSITVEDYAGFECIAEMRKVDSCLIIDVDWSPGADMSGCDIRLKTKDQDFGKSTLYMIY